MVDGRTDDGAWIYYMLNNDPKGPGELIRTAPFSNSGWNSICWGIETGIQTTIRTLAGILLVVG